MRVEVDTSKCVGHGMCNATAPEVYDLDDDGYCLIKVAEVAAALQKQAREGADSCPEQAITVTD